MKARGRADCFWSVNSVWATTVPDWSSRKALTKAAAVSVYETVALSFAPSPLGVRVAVESVSPLRKPPGVVDVPPGVPVEVPGGGGSGVGFLPTVPVAGSAEPLSSSHR